MLNQRSNGNYSFEEGLPIAVYTVGTELQLPITRLEGYSAHQLLFTFSGTGKFRLLGQEHWDILQPGSLLYVPAKLPNEYRPLFNTPWHVGYVSYLEGAEGMLKSWGFGAQPFTCSLQNVAEFLPFIHDIWMNSGLDPKPWKSTEMLILLCLKLLKQIHRNRHGQQSVSFRKVQETVVESTIRFMHDHLGRRITMDELSEHAGYSSKQLTRIFQQEMHQTPTRYLQNFRLKTANLLLIDNPELNVRQVAATVGLEPVYFSKLYRRYYGYTPSLTPAPTKQDLD
ncbi:AraC family transcriptional regulator [Paenibacillus sp. FSL R7-0345]|uniref:AraC family transcriptional regulator n=1 Tax=Paenibacillus sp. FSL R7-0345 TaxID=2954535 RepID=UPI00315AB379